MIKEILDSIQQRFRDALDPMFDFAYQIEWWGVVLLALALAVVIAYFLPFRWVRASLGFIVLLFVAAAAGATHAAQHFKNERKRDRERIRELESQSLERPKSWW